ncbi:hypothetical protein [Motilimonas eburnea]|uniref:hypothetical protein n=1 Tax=Motilimonas eburnea TaxID=1737488 RepID=UPI001E2C677B|nr:hypothetical protein [Motilimonas eburnea]MCE2570710.1 hypothetical protein [Motilimonas eburnea]
MNEIKGLDKIEAITNQAWTPGDLAIVEAMNLTTNPSNFRADLAMQALCQPRGKVWPDYNSKMVRCLILFSGVGSLNLYQFSGDTQIMGFDIDYRGDDGLENINFEIFDYEDDRISFTCDEIEILSAESVWKT